MREGGSGLMTEGEANWERVTPSPRSDDQTRADRVNVFLLRCFELLKRQHEGRPANISLYDRLGMNQSICGHLGLCVCLCVYAHAKWFSVKH